MKELDKGMRLMEESCLMTNCQIAEAIFFGRHLALSSRSAVKIFLCFGLLLGHTFISSRTFSFSLCLCFPDAAAEGPQCRCAKKLGHKTTRRAPQILTFWLQTLCQINKKLNSLQKRNEANVVFTAAYKVYFNVLFACEEAQVSILSSFIYGTTILCLSAHLIIKEPFR